MISILQYTVYISVAAAALHITQLSHAYSNIYYLEPGDFMGHGFPTGWRKRSLNEDKEMVSSQWDDAVSRLRKRYPYTLLDNNRYDDSGFPSDWKRKRIVKREAGANPAKKSYYAEIPNDMYSDAGFPSGWDRRKKSNYYMPSSLYSDAGFPSGWDKRGVGYYLPHSSYGDAGFPSGWDKRSGGYYLPHNSYADAGFPSGWDKKRGSYYSPHSSYSDAGFPSGWEKRGYYYHPSNLYDDGGFPSGWDRRKKNMLKHSDGGDTKEKRSSSNKSLEGLGGAAKIDAKNRD